MWSQPVWICFGLFFVISGAMLEILFSINSLLTSLQPAPKDYKRAAIFVCRILDKSSTNGDCALLIYFSLFQNLHLYLSDERCGMAPLSPFLKLVFHFSLFFRRHFPSHDYNINSASNQPRHCSKTQNILTSGLVA